MDIFTLILLFATTPTFANSVTPDQMASASDQDSHCLSLYEFVRINNNNLIGSKWKMGAATGNLNIQQDKG